MKKNCIFKLYRYHTNIIMTHGKGRTARRSRMGYRHMFTPLKKHSRTDQIVGEIRSAITAGTFRTGDKLPPERELALMFGVSRTSIREAVKILETYGQIQSVQGGGLYVADQFTENVFDFLGHGSYITAANYAPLYQARLVMETGSIMAALGNITGEDIGRLEECVGKTLTETDIVQLQRLDADFHITLIQASRNPILTSLYRMIYKIMANGIQQGVSVYPTAKKMVVADHRKIINAVKSRSKTRCYNAIAGHLQASMDLFTGLFGLKPPPGGEPASKA